MGNFGFYCREGSKYLFIHLKHRNNDVAHIFIKY